MKTERRRLKIIPAVVASILVLLGNYSRAGMTNAVASALGFQSSSSGSWQTTDNPRIPKLFRPDGKLTHAAFTFTTKAYEREALKQVIQEANHAAKELHLPEKLPITESNIVRAFIVGYGLSHLPPGAIGNIHTRDYGYFVSIGHKFSYVQGAHQNKDGWQWREQYVWPVSRMDTNSAYQLATQWLDAVSMDVAGLNRDCRVRIRTNAFWNAGLKRGTFVPIYDVSWISPQNRAEGYGDAASVSLFAPTRTLISLCVEESKYILRKPIVFTNLDALLAEPTK